MTDLHCGSMRKEDALVGVAYRYKWLLPVAVFLLSRVSVEYYFDASISFSWLWATNALAVLWLALDAHYRASNLPDLRVFVATLIALGCANLLGGGPLQDGLVMSVVNAIEIYLAAWLFANAVNKGCSLTDGLGFSGKLLKVGGALGVLLASAAVAISVYFNHRYGAPVAYGAGAWMASSLASYIFVLPVLISVCNPERGPHSAKAPLLIVVGFIAYESLEIMSSKAILYDFIEISALLTVAALFLRLRIFALIGFCFVALELFDFMNETGDQGLGPLQTNLVMVALLGIVVSTAIVTSRARLLQQLTADALHQSKKKQQQLELALKSADISLFELDIESGEATLIDGHHPVLTKGSRIRLAEALSTMIPSESEAIQLREALSQDNAQATFAVRYGPESKRYWSAISTGVSYLGDGRTKRLVLRQDVTNLMQQSETLRETSERQKELFSVVGHELRTPVASIAMVADASDLTDTEKLRTVKDLATNLLSVLEDMRSVVVPERARNSKEAVGSPDTVVERAVNVVKPIAREHAINLQLNLGGIPPIFRLREQALRQLVINLAKNAILHSNGKNVWVSVAEIKSDDGESLAQLRVEDDGTGIPQDQVEQLFSAFSRGNSKHDGTGLGLFIARKLVEELKGSLEYLDSVDHGGACFVARFPLYPAEKQLETDTQTHITFDGLRILLAEDDRMLRMLTEKVLGGRGAIVQSFENGKLALDAWQEGAFDLVLTDLMMPQMDGSALTKALRERGCTLPIVGVTAAVVGTETDQLIADGANAVIAKPISIEALVTVLARIREVAADD